VVLLGHELWAHRYHSDPGIVGRSLTIDGRPHTVAGVMPPHFAFPTTHRLWVPLEPLADREPRGQRSLFTFARLAPGVSDAQAAAELNAIAARLAEEYPATNDGYAAVARDLRAEFLPPDVPIILWLMMTGATLVLFIACSNVANLLLARAAVRRREIAVRTALGAGRGRIVKQLLVESVTLALLSVPLGLILAQVGTHLIAGAMPPDQVPYYITWRVDARSLVYSIAIAVTTAILFGLFPALQASRGNLHESLKEGTRGNSAARSLLRSSLVVAQVSLALVSLVMALLFVRTFVNLDSAESGFDARPLMTMRFAMAGEAYETSDARLRRVEDIVRRVEALPGVEAAFASNYIALSGGGGGGSITIEGRAAVDPAERPSISFIGVTPGFHRTLGLPIVAGRDFAPHEGYARTAVAVINEAMANEFWNGLDAIGRRFAYGSGESAVWYTVIGIARDYMLYGVDPGNTEPASAAFVPYAYQQTLNTGLTVRVAGGDPAAITGGVRRALREADANLALFQARTMDDTRQLRYWQYGLFGWIFGAIGVLGLLLASIGVYGVLSYAVSQRTQEIGVRMALGAGGPQVLRLVVSHGLWLAGIGVVTGLVLAPAGTWVARSLLFNVSPFDPLTFIVVAVLLMSVAFLASYLPARRAMRTDPAIALRTSE
jgi:putative ABC transport system permease protein